MDEDRITVDEPLISTDVDSLIRTIAEKKKVQLDDLRRECRIDKKTMDKWIAVLEDEGYIDVKYGLGGTSIIWRSMAESVQSSDSVPQRAPLSSMRPARVQSHDISPIKEMEEEAEGTIEESAESGDGSGDEDSEASQEPEGEDPHQNPEFTSAEPLEEESPAPEEPEELLSRYLAKKRDASEDIDSLKSSILTNMDEKPEAKTEVIEPEEGPEEQEDASSEESVMESDEEGSEEAAEEADPPQDNEEPLFHAEEKEEEHEEKPQEMPTIRPTRTRPPSVDVREFMSSYLDEINKEKNTIERLKRDKEELYRERVATMEGRMQADVVVLTEKIVEAQSRLADLKEHVLELPDKVDELDRLQKQMDALRAEGRDALERTRENADDFLSRLQDSKSEVEGKLSQAGLDLDSYSGKMKELEKLNSSLDGRSVRLKSALDSAKSQAEELNSAIAALTSDLEAMEKAKAGIAQTVETARSSVAERGSELESLQQELEGIERMEHWVQEYVRDYEQKINDIENYVSKSDDEMADLKEAAESLYLKKYLGELESMTEAYQAELEDAVTEEAAIEQRIAESRDRITELVKESQEMIKKVREDSPDAGEKGFGIMVAKAKARTAMTKRLVEEKQNERRNLATESDQTSRSAKSRPAKRKPLKKKKAAAKKKRK